MKPYDFQNNRGHLVETGLSATADRVALEAPEPGSACGGVMVEDGIALVTVVALEGSYPVHAAEDKGPGRATLREHAGERLREVKKRYMDGSRDEWASR